MLFLVIVFFSILLVFDGFNIYKNKKVKEKATYFFIFCISFLLFLLISLNVKIPSPTIPIKNLILNIVGS